MPIAFDLRTQVDWTAPLRQPSWALLPLGSRPMVETWVERVCAEQDAPEIVIAINPGEALAIKEALGDGSRWGCRILYTDSTLGDCAAVFNKPGLLGEGLTLRSIDSLQALFETNQSIVRGTLRLAVQPGYQSADGEAVGLEPILAPSARFSAPLILGDHVRVDAFAEVGPGTVIGDHSVIGRGSRILNSVVFSNTYVGEGLNVEGRILDGNRLIDPVDGVAVELDDLLLADLGSRRGKGVIGRIKRWFATPKREVPIQ